MELKITGCTQPVRLQLRVREITKKDFQPADRGSRRGRLKARPDEDGRGTADLCWMQNIWACSDCHQGEFCWDPGFTLGRGVRLVLLSPWKPPFPVAAPLLGVQGAVSGFCFGSAV